MKAYLKSICDLQPRYSAENTPEMQERGRILRSEIKPYLQNMRVLAEILGPFGDDFYADASDGIGRKTELPWVRFCSKSMSPSATEGFYCVIHFSTDGSAIHITIGSGSSRFHNGSNVVLPDEELDRQTAWARSVISQKFMKLEPFTDDPDFGAKRKLPLSFQRATAISKRINYEDINDTDVEEILKKAAEYLRAIYEAQSIGRDLTQADQVELETEAVIRPQAMTCRRQGYGLPAVARREVELRAMIVAQQWLSQHGYVATDCSARESYDLHVKRGAEELKVEVKGTTSDFIDAVLMTKNEVELHKREKGKTGLIIVSSVMLSKIGETFVASGGIADALIGWDIDKWDIEPTAFRITKKS